MRRGKIICFTGIDGSGKTTLAKYLTDELHRRGVDTRYVYGRYQPAALRPLMYLGKLLFFRNKNMFQDYSDYAGSKKEAAREHTLLARLYQRLLFWEYALQLTFRVSLPVTILNRTLVCDRYIIDTVVTDLAVDFHYSEEEVEEVIREMYGRFPRPDVTFLIDLPEEIAMERKDDTPSVQYLEERRRLYLMSAETVGAVVLDGSLPRETIRESVLQHSGVAP